MLRLVGRWDGRQMNLSEPAQAAAIQDATRMRECAQAPGTSSADPIPPVLERVKRDEAFLRSNGILLLQFGPCNGTVFLGVAVADQKTVDLLTERYGRVEIAGWLQPVS